VPFGDGTEVGDKPKLGKNVFARDVSVECAGAGGRMRQGERGVFG